MTGPDVIIEHLKMIEAIIDRLARSSFAVKATASAVTTAIVAVVITQEAPWAGLGVILLFFLWVLDAGYLAREYAFRALYDQVRVATGPGPDGPYSMKHQRVNVRRHAAAMSTWSQALFHVPLILTASGSVVVITLR